MASPKKILRSCLPYKKVQKLALREYLLLVSKKLNLYLLSRSLSLPILKRISWRPIMSRTIEGLQLLVMVVTGSGLVTYQSRIIGIIEFAQMCWLANSIVHWYLGSKLLATLFEQNLKEIVPVSPSAKFVATLKNLKLGCLQSSVYLSRLLFWHEHVLTLSFIFGLHFSSILIRSQPSLDC